MLVFVRLADFQDCRRSFRAHGQHYGRRPVDGFTVLAEAPLIEETPRELVWNLGHAVRYGRNRSLPPVRTSCPAIALRYPRQIPAAVKNTMPATPGSAPAATSLSGLRR